MMMTGPLLTWIQKLIVQHFTLEVKILFTKVTTFTPVFRLLLVMGCVSSPCENGGTCYEVSGSITCECAFGYDGTQLRG